MRFTLIVITVVLLATVCQAQDVMSCTNETTRGYYGFTCTGSMSPAPQAAQVPFNILGTVTSDYNGLFTGSSTAMVAGAKLLQSITTASNTLNSDCTGVIVYNQSINGQPAGQLTFMYHVLDGGKEIRGMSLDAGVNLSCSLRRIHK